MGRGRVFRLRLAHVRRWLVRVGRWARRLSAGLLRCGMTSVMRDGGILRTRSGRITRTRCALMFRRTRYAIRLRGGIAMRRRLGLVHMRWRMRRLSRRFCSRGAASVVRNRRLTWPWGRSVFRRLFGLSSWRTREQHCSGEVRCSPYLDAERSHCCDWLRSNAQADAEHCCCPDAEC